MSRRQVTKQVKPVFSLEEHVEDPLKARADAEGLVEVLNNQRGRDQSMGWGVYRGGKIYIVGTTRQLALLNLAQGRKVLNLPDS